VGVREARALPWPNLFDAFGVEETAAFGAKFTIIASSRITLASEC